MSRRRGLVLGLKRVLALERGLGLRQQAKHGDEGAVAVAKHLVQVGECMGKAAVGTNAQQIAKFEQALVDCRRTRF